MPQETLTFPPLYCVVGAYRLAHDPSLWKPMWAKCSKAAKQAGIVGLLWALLTWPFQRLFVYYFMSASASVTGFGALYGKLVDTDSDLPVRIPLPSLQTFATLMFVLGQVHAIMEFWLRRKLRDCRNTAYLQTVKSRGKAADWWTEYVEEFSNPPTQKAIKDAKKQGWYLKLASPLVRFLILKVFLLPVDFVPFFGMVLGAALRSLTYGRLLHKGFFEAKRMSPFQIELWITERQAAYRSFGFTAALMERIPLLGLIFSVSNQIGAAMWAHDLEKRQQRFRASTTTATTVDGSGSGSSSGAVQLEEFKSKPTLKKLYKEANSTTTATSSADASSSSDGGGGAGGSFNGEGLAVLRRAPSPYSSGGNSGAVFTNLSFTFPLKLIAPTTSARNATLALSGRSDLASSPKAVSPLYIVGYGGGLVSGDSVDLDVDVGTGCTLLVLTQGSTKVFKTRTTAPTRGVSTASYTSPSSVEHTSQIAAEAATAKEATRQGFRFLVRPHATLVLLPDPVTCFAASKYDQVQRFDLRDRQSSSLVVLDWITPGRTAVAPSTSTSTPATKLNHLDSFSATLPAASAGGMSKDYSTSRRDAELWAFSSYRSRNEVRSSSQVVARDVVLLSQDLASPTSTLTDPVSGLSFSELARRNHPYRCYATLLLAGPDAQPIIHSLTAEFEAIQQRPTTTLSHDVLWSLSSVDASAVAIASPPLVVVRIAGSSAQSVRSWLHARLTSLQAVIGSDLYRQALAS